MVCAGTFLPCFYIWVNTACVIIHEVTGKYNLMKAAVC
jgi:hypothetical protein